MRAAGFPLNTGQYDVLARLSPEHNTVKDLVEEMLADGLTPNVSIYNELINKAPDYGTAKAWVEKMQEAGVVPTEATFSALFNKCKVAVSPSSLLTWYLEQPYHPPIPLNAAITSYKESGRLKWALRVALDYPQIAAARAIIREIGKEALDYFSSVETNNPNHPNVAYALGIACLELGLRTRAKDHLEKALSITTIPSRKKTIQICLAELNKIGP
jgi:tetratricopeptide (TPR) repeat protein